MSRTASAFVLASESTVDQGADAPRSSSSSSGSVRGSTPYLWWSRTRASVALVREPSSSASDLTSPGDARVRDDLVTALRPENLDRRDQRDIEVAVVQRGGEPAGVIENEIVLEPTGEAFDDGLAVEIADGTDS